MHSCFVPRQSFWFSTLQKAAYLLLLLEVPRYSLSPVVNVNFVCPLSLDDIQLGWCHGNLWSLCFEQVLKSQNISFGKLGTWVTKPANTDNRLGLTEF